MVREFVHSAKYLQDVRLHDQRQHAFRQAELRDEHRSPQRIRMVLGEKLISLGERLIDRPNSELGPVDKAA